MSSKYWRKPLDRGTIQTRAKQEKIIIGDRCKGCGFCIAFCPRGVLQFSEDFNKKGYHYPKVIDSSKCADCHFCDALCPEFAIYSVDADRLPGKPDEASSKSLKEKSRE